VVTRKIIKYQNRKLYDTILSCYVDLGEVAQFIREGQDVYVECHKTKKDITIDALRRIIHNTETVSPINKELLTRIIKSFDGTYSTYIAELEHEMGYFEAKKVGDKEQRKPNQMN